MKTALELAEETARKIWSNFNYDEYDLGWEASKSEHEHIYSAVRVGYLGTDHAFFIDEKAQTVEVQNFTQSMPRIKAEYDNSPYNQKLLKEQNA